MSVFSLFKGRSRLLKEGLWVTFGQVGAILGTLVGVRLLTELLPPQIFGEVILLTGVAALVLALTGTPYMQAVLRFYPDSVRDSSVGTLRAAAIQQLLLSGACVGGIWIVGWLVYSWYAAATIWLGLLLVPLLGLDVARSLELVFFNAARRQRPMALWTTAEAWGRPAMAVIAVTLVGTSSTTVLTSYVAASALIMLFFVLSTPRDGVEAGQSGKGKHTKELGWELFRYALPLMPIGIISWVSNQADRYVIGGLMSIEEAGLYAAAYGIASRPAMSLCGIVETTLRPIYFHAVSSGDAGRIRRIFLAWLGMVSLMAAAIYGLFALFSQPIAGLLLGEQYRASTSLMPLIAAGYSLLAVAQVFAGTMYARHNTRGVMLSEISGAVARFVFGAVGIYFFGILGAAASVPAAFGAQLLVAASLSVRNKNFSSAGIR